MSGRADPAVALDLLARGDITVKGRMPRSSNATFLVEVALAGAPALQEDLRRVVSDELPPALAELLDPDEQRALKRRARGLLRTGQFPVDKSGLRYPWPLI